MLLARGVGQASDLELEAEMKAVVKSKAKPFLVLLLRGRAVHFAKPKKERPENPLGCFMCGLILHSLGSGDGLEPLMFNHSGNPGFSVRGQYNHLRVHFGPGIDGFFDLSEMNVG